MRNTPFFLVIEGFLISIFITLCCLINSELNLIVKFQVLLPLFFVSTFHPLFSRFSPARKVSSMCFLSFFLPFDIFTLIEILLPIVNCHIVCRFPPLSLYVCRSSSLSLCAFVALSVDSISLFIFAQSRWGLFMGVAWLVAVKVARFQEVRRDMFHTGPISCRYVYTIYTQYIHRYIVCHQIQ